MPDIPPVLPAKKQSKKSKETHFKKTTVFLPQNTSLFMVMTKKRKDYPEKKTKQWETNRKSNQTEAKKKQIVKQKNRAKKWEGRSKSKESTFNIGRQYYKRKNNHRNSHVLHLK